MYERAHDVRWRRWVGAGAPVAAAQPHVDVWRSAVRRQRQRAAVQTSGILAARRVPADGIQGSMAAPFREITVAPDRFEVVADDVVLVAELCSAIAVCIYDAVEEAGALLHLRFIVRANKPADVTDTTLATELLLLDRCIESLCEAAPGARNMQARIAAHLPEEDAMRACESVLVLVRHFLEDRSICVSPTDVAAGAPRLLKFRPAMGWLQIR